MKTFTLLFNAIRDKTKEIGYSFLLLVVLTLPCSCLLFHFEPDYDFCQAISWSFLQYIDNAGGFVQPPVTYAGGVIACVLTILKYAFFMFFFSIFGKGFIEQIQKEQDKENINKLENCFRWTQDKVTKYIVPPRYISLATIQVKCQLDTKQIWDAVNASLAEKEKYRHYRIGNLATLQPADNNATDKLVVESFPLNIDYGCYIDRGSNVTIVCTSNYTEVGSGAFYFFLAKLGGFNYASREVASDMVNPVSFYKIKDENADDKLPIFLQNIRTLTQRKNSWVIFMLISDGQGDEEYKTQMHYVYGKEENGKLNDSTINEMETFKKLYNELEEGMKPFDIKSDKHKYYKGGEYKQTNIASHIIGEKSQINAFTIRFNYDVICINSNYLKIAESMAKIIRKNLVDNNEENDDLLREEDRKCGYDYDEIQ